jgi:hypothetical protein
LPGWAVSTFAEFLLLSNGVRVWVDGGAVPGVMHGFGGSVDGWGASGVVGSLLVGCAGAAVCTLAAWALCGSAGFGFAECLATAALFRGSRELVVCVALWWGWLLGLVCSLRIQRVLGMGGRVGVQIHP